MKHEDQKKQRQEIYLVFLGGIFAVYLVYSFLFSPMLKKSKELSQTLTQKDNTTRTLYSQMAQYDIFAQNFKTALKNIEPQKNKFVSNPTSYEYVNYIKNIVFLNGLNILSINGSEQTDFQANTKDYEATDPYTVYDEGDKNLPVIMLQSVKLEVVGSYEGIKKMVNTLNQEKRVIINNAEYKSYIKSSTELNDKLKEYEAQLSDVNLLQENIKKSEEDRKALMEQLKEIEGKNKKNVGELTRLFDLKAELEEKTKSLEGMYSEAVKNINDLTKEKEKAEVDAQKNSEELERIKQENQKANSAMEDLNEELNKVKKLNKQLEEEKIDSEKEKQTIESNYSDLQNENDFLKKKIDEIEVGDTIENDENTVLPANIYYNEGLMTDSGNDLMNMLMALRGATAETDSAVQMSKKWEEEEEEIITNENDPGSKIIRTTRKKTEISVKYMSNNDDK